MNDCYNTILVNCKQMTEDIRMEKGLDNEHISIEYLAYAAMLIYHDSGLVDVLYDIFANTEFVYIDEPIDEFIGRKYDLNEKNKERMIEHARYTFLESTLTTRKHGAHIDRKIYINYSEDVPVCLIMYDFIHQLNHILTSFEDPLIEKNGVKYSRMGFAFDSLDDRSVTGLILEESINEIETNEILNVIYYLSTLDIEDDEIADDLAEIAEEYASCQEMIETPKNELTSIIKPLFDDNEFAFSLSNARINGDIFQLINLFNQTMGENSFENLLRNLNMIDNPKYNKKSQEQAKVIAKKLIKTYNSHAEEK